MIMGSLLTLISNFLIRFKNCVLFADFAWSVLVIPTFNFFGPKPNGTKPFPKVLFGLMSYSHKNINCGNNICLECAYFVGKRIDQWVIYTST